MSTLTIALTGATGLVGSRIKELLETEFNIITLPQNEMDIRQRSTVETKLHQLEFDLLLHMAAYTDVDRAETDKDSCHSLNVEGTRNLFETTQNMGKKMIYISTDFVFDGSEEGYDENSTPKPIGYYGQTKYEGEQIVRGNAMIVRISYPYRAVFADKTDIVRSILSILEESKTIKGITDNLITPTFVDDVAASLKHLINSFAPEIYHIVGGDSLSGFDLARTIADSFGLNRNLIVPTTFAEFYSGRARRPKNSNMKSVKNNFYKMKALLQGLEELKLQMGR